MSSSLEQLSSPARPASPHFFPSRVVDFHAWKAAALAATHSLTFYPQSVFPAASQTQFPLPRFFGHDPSSLSGTFFLFIFLIPCQLEVSLLFLLGPTLVPFQFCPTPPVFGQISSSLLSKSLIFTCGLGDTYHGHRGGWNKDGGFNLVLGGRRRWLIRHSLLSLASFCWRGFMDGGGGWGDGFSAAFTIGTHCWVTSDELTGNLKKTH